MPERLETMLRELRSLDQVLDRNPPPTSNVPAELLMRGGVNPEDEGGDGDDDAGSAVVSVRRRGSRGGSSHV